MTLRFLTAGESHGPELVAILEGLPAGLAVDLQALATLMARRRQGFGSGGRMKIERDEVLIVAGVLEGSTTGAPVAVRIANRDYDAWAGRDIEPMTVPRPGHADLTASLKHDYPDLRYALERASARETAARVAIGGLCLQLLAAVGIRIGGYVTAIGPVQVTFDTEPDYDDLLAAAATSPVRCPDAAASRAMVQAIEQTIRDRDTLGGVFEVVVLGAPPGLGSHAHADRRLTGRLLAAAGTIPAVKGAEIGPAFDNAQRTGTTTHDRIVRHGDEIRRTGNRAGGLEGGITTGQPLILRCAMKPLSSTLTPLESVDLATGAPAVTAYERSDICAVPRAAVVGEAVVALVMAQAVLERVGGDTMDQVRERVAALPRGRLSDFHLRGSPWRLGYPDNV